MAKAYFTYNDETCRYEPVVQDGKHFLRNAGIFLGLAFFVSVSALFFYRHHAVALSEEILQSQNNRHKSEWEVIDKRIAQAATELERLIEKDDHNYRIILDSQPLGSSIRDAGTGGSEKMDLTTVRAFPDIYEGYKRIDKLARQVDIERQSFTELHELLEQKMRIWASRPAIQPIDNRQLDRLHLTFGPRMHPIFRRVIDHNGLDFTASKGTPVYATGDGRVIRAYHSASYGKVIFIDHGHGFETRYAHLSEFKARPGDRVKRGQVIGLVGNTGNSVSSHLHYEVLYKGQHINPINFFQRDLSNSEYERLIQVGSQQSEPLD
ncbi:MAG TPA: M23 family metallopeptidase [Cyclobacteriaceae bacterium]|nr:M23 family metallopeptidase [Cyclobacteriaceae bacterium]